MEIKRICEWCNTEFIAQRSTTKYCSHTCNSRAYKAKKRGEKIEQIDPSKRKSPPVKNQRKYNDINSKEFLSAKELAVLLNCSLRTTYRLINTGVINSFNFGERKTIIRRIDIDALFNKSKTVNTTTTLNTDPNKIDMTPDFSETYTIGELSTKFGLSEKGAYNLLKINKVPKQKRGKYTHVPKSIIDELLR